MPKVLVLFYSSYGHAEAMAAAVDEEGREDKAQVDIKCVPELVPDEVAQKSHYKVDRFAPVAKLNELATVDAVTIGGGTRFGRIPSRMAVFLNQAGGLWARGALRARDQGRHIGEIANRLRG